LEPAEGTASLDERDHLLEPTEAGRARREHLDAPPLPLGVARVHAEKLGGEETRLVAAGAGADLEHGVPLVVRVLREQELLQRGVEGLEATLERGQLGAPQLPQLDVLAVRELTVLLDLSGEPPPLAPRGDRLFELR